MAQEMCKVHPDKEITDVCMHCGKGVCVSCAASLAGKTYCLECIKVVDANAVCSAKPVAWENRSEAGFFKALFDTWKDVLLHPKKFFSCMPTKAGMGSPLLFAIIWGSLAITISALFNMITVISGATAPNLPAGTALPPKAVMAGSYFVLIILSPLLVVAGVFLISAIYHGVILLLGGREGFRATFRVLAYSNALAIFNIIPLAGPILVTIYSLFLFTTGFKSAHKMGTVRAAVAALLPMILLFIIGFAAAFYMASQGALTGPANVPPAPMPVQ